ncbi:MAG TPA: hypothetical protein VGG74_21250 [Kofleriaceae bacterium]|jgi:hypothetical protein
MSLLDSLAAFKTGCYVVTRTTYAPATGGVYAAPDVSTIEIDAVVVPYGGELEALPEGVNASMTRVIGTSIELLDAANGRTPDSIAIGADNFLVFRVDGPVMMPDSVHYRAFAARRRLP